MDNLWLHAYNLNKWITLDNIMDFDCIHIDLTSFSFTSSDMNRYLKAWINGCNYRMKLLIGPAVFEDGTNIRSKDGRRATFKQIIDRDYLDSERHFPFKMVVWPADDQ
ncbi:hypothetical protein GCK72_015011 [Caenorhabditis remanei]|uniref:Sdz-33 F-box domain-containing protein n=1 Tax=Caenorhabditis remanei TaxID=31234 RepID=A0A6A5GW07_CAERE|nr:hypothetical protein GCK72_015011 [Caenorhabditis remanei]KAF1758552.1 hypothetical protein GCK72_015011 [Caenorhabditis remanei]